MEVDEESSSQQVNVSEEDDVPIHDFGWEEEAFTEDIGYINIQRNIQQLLQSEANSPVESNEEHPSQNSSNDISSYSEDSEECNSNCESPCKNVKHLECQIMNEIITSFKNSQAIEDQTDKEMLNKILFSHKPKSK